jgi:hypothetical protein
MAIFGPINMPETPMATCKSCGASFPAHFYHECGPREVDVDNILAASEARIRELEKIAELSATRASRATRSYYVGRVQHAEERAAELETLLREIADDEALQSFEIVKKVRRALGKQ